MRVHKKNIPLSHLSGWVRGGPETKQKLNRTGGELGKPIITMKVDLLEEIYLCRSYESLVEVVESCSKVFMKLLSIMKA